MSHPKGGVKAVDIYADEQRLTVLSMLFMQFCDLVHCTYIVPGSNYFYVPKIAQVCQWLCGLLAWGGATSPLN